MPTGVYKRNKEMKTGKHMFGRVVSEITKKKMSDGLKVAYATGKRRKYWLGKKMPPFTEEHKRKISEANKGRRPTEETRRKMSEFRKGRKHSSGQTAKII